MDIQWNIKKSSNILDVKIKDFINELDVIINDMELLNGLNVRLIDINKNSIVLMVDYI